MKAWTLGNLCIGKHEPWTFQSKEQLKQKAFKNVGFIKSSLIGSSFKS